MLTGAFSLESNAAEQDTPASVVDAFRKQATGHACDVQVLMSDNVVARDKVRGDLTGVVKALVADMSVDFGDLGAGPLFTARALLAAGADALDAGQLGGCFGSVARVIDDLAVAGHRKRRETNVDAKERDRINLIRRRVKVTHEPDRPSAVAATMHCHLFDCALDRTIEMDPDVGELRQMETLAKQLRAVLTGVTRHRKRIVQPLALEPRVTRIFSGFKSAVECPEREIDATQRGALYPNRHRTRNDVGGPPLSEALRLIIQRWAFAEPLVALFALLQRGII
jgi:hypothetical protein